VHDHYALSVRFKCDYDHASLDV